MDIFDRASKIVKEVSESIVNAGNIIGAVTKEQGELEALKIKKESIEKKIEAGYIEIGKRYMFYSQGEASDAFNVSDIIEKIQPDLIAAKETNRKIAERELQIKRIEFDLEKKKAQTKFETMKDKLDQALELEIITADEYKVKLAAAQKKLDCFKQIKNLELQFQMKIITKSEYEQKLEKLLK